MTINIELTTLTESNADSFLLTFRSQNQNKHILIDGGLKRDGRQALKLIEKIFEQGDIIDLVVLTHVDIDHVNGLLAFFESDNVNADNVRRVLFNVPNSIVEPELVKDKKTQCGYKEGNQLLELIIKKGINFTQAVEGDQFNLGEGIVIDILSPTKCALELDHENWLKTNIGHDEDEEYDKEKLIEEKHKEDRKPQNLSSIVCLITCDEKKMLFCGDSTPSQIIKDGLGETPVDIFKVPHHGSKFNINRELLTSFPSNKYLIPGNKSSYPNYFTIALIENNFKNSEVYVPKGSWVHSERMNKDIELDFVEYEFGTRINL
ncbi:ComEC/Rec2 family competence protein [Photobacterium sp. GSS17]|uniref:ComEC/Rec2 family competence protein n=1 Tax=Photobacterium sp. GSS17 TaxID=3020715 RepID=UPI00235EBC30|nr:MBL fold metallo-hydrolase [Photobacterium sp. GSS17]